jgi:hypothetical protein
MHHVHDKIELGAAGFAKINELWFEKIPAMCEQFIWRVSGFKNRQIPPRWLLAP